jgi:hypothetical protein
MNHYRFRFWILLLPLTLFVTLILILFMRAGDVSLPPPPAAKKDAGLSVTVAPSFGSRVGFDLLATTTTPPVAPPNLATLFSVKAACDHALGRNIVEEWDRTTDPVLSPDGGRQAQSVNELPAHLSRLRLANSDGSDEIWLEAPRARGYTGTLLPAIWSPDGRRLALREINLSQPGGGTLYSVSRDGAEVIRLAGYYGYHDQIAWSPDSRYIAFTHGIVFGQGSNTNVGDYRVYVVAADGSTPVYLFGSGCRPLP